MRNVSSQQNGSRESARSRLPVIGWVAAVIAVLVTAQPSFAEGQTYVPPPKLLASAEAGDVEAQSQLALDFYKVSAYEQSRYWRRKAADGGDAFSQYAMSIELSKSDPGRSREWLVRSAQQAYPNAAVDVARGFADGHGGFPVDQEKATYFWQKAAETDWTGGATEYGVRLYEGTGCEANRELAKEWLAKGTRQRDGRAEFYLGRIYKDGALSGAAGNADREKGVRYYQASAEKGYVDAQHELGDAYYYGYGAPKDFTKSYKWYRLAADNGNARSQYQAALMLSAGKGVSPNEDEAIRLLKASASQGNTFAVGTLRLLKEQQAASQHPAKQGPFPPRPMAQAGKTTCTTNCQNGDCYRTYDNGRQVHFQAQQKWNPLESRFEFDAGGC